MVRLNRGTAAKTIEREQGRKPPPLQVNVHILYEKLLCN